MDSSRSSRSTSRFRGGTKRALASLPWVEEKEGRRKENKVEKRKERDMGKKQRVGGGEQNNRHILRIII